MNLCLKRKGQFTANWINTNGMCGLVTNKYDTVRTYAYECLIEADSTELDSNGFIIDQLQINDYFAHKYNGNGAVAARSCERIAIEAVKEVADLLYAKGHRKVYRIAVTISPLGTEVASMTCEWTKTRDEHQTPAPEPITVNGFPMKDGAFTVADIGQIPVAPPVSLLPVKYGIFYTQANGSLARSANYPKEYEKHADAGEVIANHLKNNGLDNGYVVRILTTSDIWPHKIYFEDNGVLHATGNRGIRGEFESKEKAEAALAAYKENNLLSFEYFVDRAGRA